MIAMWISFKVPEHERARGPDLALVAAVEENVEQPNRSRLM
jgi:hypothetical protein